MDVEYESIVKALADYPPSGADGSFIDFFVVGSVTEGNVREVLKLMSKNAELNRAFWSVINRAPLPRKGGTPSGGSAAT